MLRHPRETSPLVIEGLLQLKIAALRRAHTARKRPAAWRGC